MVVELKQPTVFLSYAHKDRDDAVFIQKRLEKAGMNVFVADEHLPAPDVWRPILFDRITNCDFFVVWRTKNYHRGRYTDQELGMGIGCKKKIIIMSSPQGSDYGFMLGYTSIEHDESRINTVMALTKEICKESSLNYNERDFHVSQLSISDNFVETIFYARELSRCTDFSVKNINDIAKACIGNDQIYGCIYGAPKLKKILRDNLEKIDSDLRKKLDEQNWFIDK